MRTLILALLWCAPAWAGSQVAVVYDAATGTSIMVVVPDRDEELNDPAYMPKGAAQVRIPLEQFNKLGSDTISRADAAKALIPVPPK